MVESPESADAIDVGTVEGNVSLGFGEGQLQYFCSAPKLWASVSVSGSLQFNVSGSKDDASMPTTDNTAIMAKGSLASTDVP